MPTIKKKKKPAKKTKPKNSLEELAKAMNTLVKILMKIDKDQQEMLTLVRGDYTRGDWVPPDNLWRAKYSCA